MIATLNTKSDDKENDDSGDGGDDRRRHLTHHVEAQGIVARFDVTVDFRHRHGFGAAAASSTMKRLRSDDDSTNDGKQLSKYGESRSGHEENRDLIRFVRAIFYRTGCWPKFHLDKQ